MALEFKAVYSYLLYTLQAMDPLKARALETIVIFKVNAFNIIGNRLKAIALKIKAICSCISPEFFRQMSPL